MNQEIRSICVKMPRFVVFPLPLKEKKITSSPAGFCTYSDKRILALLCIEHQI